jgi:hypothetical protein
MQSEKESQKSCFARPLAFGLLARATFASINSCEQLFTVDEKEQIILPVSRFWEMERASFILD